MHTHTHAGDRQPSFAVGARVCLAFVVVVVVVFQLSGLGKLRPNTLVVGYKGNWIKCSDEEIQEYVSLLQ